MNGVVLKRGPASEDESGDLSFTVTVKAGDKAAFFQAFPGFVLDISSRGDPTANSPANPATAQKTPHAAPLAVVPPPVQELSVEGGDFFSDGMRGGVGVSVQDVLFGIVQNPLFVEYTLLCAKKKWQDVPDGSRFAMEFIREWVGVDFEGITTEDLLPLQHGFAVYLRERHPGEPPPDFLGGRR